MLSEEHAAQVNVRERTPTVHVTCKRFLTLLKRPTLLTLLMSALVLCSCKARRTMTIVQLPGATFQGLHNHAVD